MSALHKYFLSKQKNRDVLMLKYNLEKIFLLLEICKLKINKNIKNDCFLEKYNAYKNELEYMKDLIIYKISLLEKWNKNPLYNAHIKHIFRMIKNKNNSSVIEFEIYKTTKIDYNINYMNDILEIKNLINTNTYDLQFREELFDKYL